MVSAMVASGILAAPLYAQPTDQAPETQQTQQAADQQTNQATTQQTNPEFERPAQTGSDTPDSLTEDIKESEHIRQVVLETLREKFSPEMREKLQFLLQPDPNRPPERQPMRAFRSWMQSKRPFFPVFILLMLSSLTVCSFFPTHISTAQDVCRRQFWQCIGKGALVAILVATASRILMAISFTHLALVAMAFVQFIALSGLCVSISLIGTRILDKCGLSEKSWMLAHPRWAMFFAVLIGCLIVALIAQIPGLGRFPKLGMRIVMLIAILGAGGLLKTRFGTRPMNSAES